MSSTSVTVNLSDYKYATMDKVVGSKQITLWTHYPRKSGDGDEIIWKEGKDEDGILRGGISIGPPWYRDFGDMVPGSIRKINIEFGGVARKPVNYDPAKTATMISQPKEI